MMFSTPAGSSQGSSMVSKTKRASSKSQGVRSAGAPGPQILTFALRDRPRATRASVPKVRSGCMTCKKRHVKCDEGKPSCTRCIKWQGFCDGYDSLAKSESQSTPSQGPSPTRSPTPHSPAGLILIEPTSNTKVFSSELEKVYFDRWLALSHNLGGGWFKAQLFTKTIPQLSQNEPAVRYAAMAVGALAHARARTAGTPLIEESSHYKSALSLYGRALRLVRLQQGPNEDSALRAAVLSCLLFITFEFLHRNRQAALRHTNHGLMIIEQFLRARKTGPTSESAGVWRLPSASSYVEVEYTHKSPAPLVLEDEILQIFQRLDYQAWSTAILNTARLGPPIWYRASASHSWHGIPKRFDDLDEARRWWDLVQHWMLHFSRTAADRLAARVALHPELADEIDIADIEGVKELQIEHLKILERWSTAFWPLYTSLWTSKADMGAYYRAVSLQLQYQVSWACVRTMTFTQYEAMASMTPLCSELVRLSSILLAQQHKADGETEVFTIDNGPTMALFIVAVKCRDSAVREEAIELLNKYPRLDGIWDSRAFLAMAKVNRELEVMNATDGDPGAQWRRLRRREARFDDRPRECTSRYYVKDETGAWKLITDSIRW